MGDVLTLELEQKALATREALQSAVQQYGKVVYSNSLGAEAMVLTGWAQTPVELLAQGEPWLASLLLKNHADD